MEMQQVRYFIAVKDTLNFTRAAELCNVSQPSLTRAIQMLESEFGGPLFNRERGNTHLTELGRIMEPYLTAVAGQAAEAKKHALAYGKLDTAPLKIGAMCTVGPAIISDLIIKFRMDHPGVEFVVSDCTAQSLTDMLIAGDLTLALFRGAGRARRPLPRARIVRGRFCRRGRAQSPSGCLGVGARCRFARRGVRQSDELRISGFRAQRVARTRRKNPSGLLQRTRRLGSGHDQGRAGFRFLPGIQRHRSRLGNPTAGRSALHAADPARDRARATALAGGGCVRCGGTQLHVAGAPRAGDATALDRQGARTIAPCARRRRVPRSVANASATATPTMHALQPKRSNTAPRIAVPANPPVKYAAR